MDKDTKEPKQKTSEEFQKAYQALCEEYGYSLSIKPVWVARDDGSFSTTINVSIETLPKKV